MATVFDLAKQQSTDGTMTDEGKKKIYDLYKQNLTATGDKQAGLDATKQALLGASTTPKTPITPKITSAVDSTKLSGNLGYTTDQVGIPGVNMSGPKTTTPPKIETTADTMGDKTIGAIDTGKDLIGGNQTGFDSGSPILDKELKDIQTDKNKAVEETKKGFILGKAEFEKNKQYYTNYDTVNNLYNGVIGDLTAGMDDNGNIPDSTYQTIANKYGLTLDEVKNPQSIFNKGELSAEGKEKLGVNAFDSEIDKFTTDYEKKKADLKTKTDQAIQAYNWQIEDVAKQLARNVGWTEAQGAWSGALRGSGYLQGIENIKKDGETTINRLNTLAQQVESASEEDLARLTEDYNLALSEAKKGFDTQLEELKKNSILALSEAQATYGMGSDKLFKTLEKINAEYGLKSNQAVSAYLTNLKSMNDLANQNISLVEKANQIEEAKINKRYTEYLANNGVVLGQTSLNTIADEVKNGTISIQKAQDLKQIMLSSIQSTLNKIAPLTTQELKTIETLLAQGFTPAQVVAELMSLDKFQKAEEDNKFGFTNVGDGVIAVTDPKTGKVRFESQSPTGETETLTGLNKIANSNIQCGKAVNTYIQDITGSYGKMGDTLDSKIQAIESIGTSDIPVKGGVFVSNPLNNTVGHTGIVQSVNSDGSITVLEANKEGKSTGGPLVENTYSAEKVKNMIFSQGLQKEDNSLLKSQVLGLTIGLGGTEGERKQIQEEIVAKAIKDKISVTEAKKKLGYKTGDDIDFAKSRKEDYQTLKKSISEATGNAKTALTLLNSPQTAIGDVASVVGFLKTIDPSSVARESEVESVENARGVLDGLSNIFTKAKEGTKLTDKQRTQLKDSIQTIVTASDNRYNEYVKDLVQEFNDRGLDPTVYIPKTEVERVLKGTTAKKETTPKATTPKTEYKAPNGKTYKIVIN